MAKAFGVQRDRVLKYMVDFNSITAAQAIADLGVYSLSSRISELKKLGYAIKKIWVKGKNRYNEDVRFAEYFIATYEGDEEKAV